MSKNSSAVIQYATYATYAFRRKLEEASIDYENSKTDNTRISCDHKIDIYTDLIDFSKVVIENIREWPRDNTDDKVIQEVYCHPRNQPFKDKLVEVFHASEKDVKRLFHHPPVYDEFFCTC